MCPISSITAKKAKKSPQVSNTYPTWHSNAGNKRWSTSDKKFYITDKARKLCFWTGQNQNDGNPHSSGRKSCKVKRAPQHSPQFRTSDGCKRDQKTQLSAKTVLQVKRENFRGSEEKSVPQKRHTNCTAPPRISIRSVQIHKSCGWGLCQAHDTPVVSTNWQCMASHRKPPHLHASSKASFNTTWSILAGWNFRTCRKAQVNERMKRTWKRSWRQSSQPFSVLKDENLLCQWWWGKLPCRLSENLWVGLRLRHLRGQVFCKHDMSLWVCDKKIETLYKSLAAWSPVTMWCINAKRSLCKLVFSSKCRRCDEVATAIGMPCLQPNEPKTSMYYAIKQSFHSIRLMFILLLALPHLCRCRTNRSTPGRSAALAKSTSNLAEAAPVGCKSTMINTLIRWFPNLFQE